MLNNKKDRQIDINIAASLFIFAITIFFIVININNNTIINSQAKDYSAARIPKTTPTISPTSTPIQSTYYLKSSEWVAANPNEATTVLAGCNEGDIAISGGLDQYTGRIEHWLTVRSTPSIEWSPNSWVLTVKNIGTSQNQFQATVKCLKKS